jgi:hypothetical protein
MLNSCLAISLTLKMEAKYSSETSWTSTELQSVTTHRVVLFVLIAVRASNLICSLLRHVVKYYIKYNYIEYVKETSQRNDTKNIRFRC